MSSNVVFPIFEGHFAAFMGTTKVCCAYGVSCTLVSTQVWLDTESASTDSAFERRSVLLAEMFAGEVSREQQCKEASCNLLQLRFIRKLLIADLARRLNLRWRLASAGS